MAMPERAQTRYCDAMSDSRDLKQLPVAMMTKVKSGCDFGVVLFGGPNY